MQHGLVRGKYRAGRFPPAIEAVIFHDCLMTNTTSNDDRNQLTEKAKLFRSLHQDQPLVLANVWDGASLAIVQQAGASAIGTTSAGVAWSLGRQDGGGLSREQAMGALRRMAAVATVPLTADIEDGYGETLDDLTITIQETIAAGAVGINIEDGMPDGSLRPLDEQQGRIARVRQVADEQGVDLFINARLDAVLFGLDDGTSEITIDRALGLVDAGADGIFVPGVGDVAAIRRLADRLRVPLNVMTGGGGLSVTEAAGAGARRVSVGMAISQIAYTSVKTAAVELLGQGSGDSLVGGLDYGEMNGLFS